MESPAADCDPKPRPAAVTLRYRMTRSITAGDMRRVARALAPTLAPLGGLLPSPGPGSDCLGPYLLWSPSSSPFVADSPDVLQIITTEDACLVTGEMPICSFSLCGAGGVACSSETVRAWERAAVGYLHLEPVVMHNRLVVPSLYSDCPASGDTHVDMNMYYGLDVGKAALKWTIASAAAPHMVHDRLFVCWRCLHTRVWWEFDGGSFVDVLRRVSTGPEPCCKECAFDLCHNTASQRSNAVRERLQEQAGGSLLH